MGLALAALGLIHTARDADRPGWFWFFLALVPVVIGLTLEWHRLWSRANNERRILRGIGRRLTVELATMERDLDRVERATRYDGFVPLPSATWTKEGTRFDQLDDVFGVVAEAYLRADAFNKDIAVRKAIANAVIGVIAEDGIADLRTAIKAARDALDRL